MRLYTSTHYALLGQLRAYFNIKGADLNLTKFADGEVLVSLPETCSQQKVILVQALSAPTNDAIIQTVFILEALRLACASSVTLIITYLGYARQDRMTRARSLISCSVVCRLLCLNAPTKVYLLEPHMPQLAGFFSTPCFSFGLTATICEHICRLYSLSEIAIIALDHGAANRAAKVSKSLGVDMICGHKHREQGQVVTSFQSNPIWVGKVGIIVDDIVDTGGSVASALHSLKDIQLKCVLVYCAHGVLSCGHLTCTKAYISNSIPHKQYSIDISYTVSRLIKHTLANSPIDEPL
ncbi:ribose-phosphate diphosphokinase [Candidatus Hodgkinia cicadicola]